jgi:hypothetical protein
MIVALAITPTLGQAPEVRPADLESIRDDLNRIRTELETVKEQLGQVLRLLASSGRRRARRQQRRRPCGRAWPTRR